MGSLSRFNLSRIIKEYNTPNLFETGTFWGDGVAYALQSRFNYIFSVEIIPEIAAKARERFKNESRVEILETDSITALEQKLSSLKGNTVFWLDAHFPGADAEMVDHSAGDDELYRLPLSKEVQLIKKYRQSFEDVLILDDLRIYEDHPYQNGLVPSNAMPKGERSLQFVYDCFANSHYIFKSFLDEGYTLLFPKETYLESHKLRTELFLDKEPFLKDHYLV